jgi:UDP-glucose 4-epimerase
VIKKILITGAFGFIGRHCAVYFSRLGFEVSGIGHGSWEEQEFSKYGIKKWKSCDVTLKNLIEFSKNDPPNLIIHAAGSASVGLSLQDPKLDYNKTVTTTKAVLEFMREHQKSCHLIVPSSAAVYGDVKNQRPINETDKLNPVSPYGINKKEAEDLCVEYSKAYGLRISIIRLFSIYGEGLRKQLLFDACEKIKKSEFTFFGTGDERRDWLHVDDAVRLFDEVSKNMESRIGSRSDAKYGNAEMINGGTGVSPTVREVLSKVFSNFKEIQDPIFNGLTKKGDPLYYQADVKRANSLGWNPEVSWQDGVTRYCKWFEDSYKRLS